MTIFGWDASHYDGDLTTAILTRAKSEGIEFFTHKIGEGLSNTDTTAAGALNAARAAGIKVIGGYYFIHSGDMVAQAVRCIALADKYVPWWREFAGWFWQTDAETDTAGHLPSPAEVKLFSDELAARSGKTVVVYASHGQYGDRLAGLGHPLWNANYPTPRQAGFKDLYPGNSYAGWTAYSGQTPAICQYTSSATIAGRTTCDANAFRGSIAELLTLINSGGTDMPLTAADANTVWSQHIPDMRDRTKPDVSAQTALSQIWGAVVGVTRSETAEAAQITALTAAVQALATSGGGTVDVTALLAGVDAAVARHTDAVLARLAAAEHAAAAALDGPPAA